MLPDLAADRGIQDEVRSNSRLRAARWCAKGYRMVSTDPHASDCLPVAGRAAACEQ